VSDNSNAADLTPLDPECQTEDSDRANTHPTAVHRLSAIDLKTNRYPLFSIVLRSKRLTDINLSLAHRVRQAPALLKHAPVIIDFSRTDVKASFDFGALFSIVRQRGLIPIAVKGISPGLMNALKKAGVPVVQGIESSQLPAPARDPDAGSIEIQPVAGPTDTGASVIVEQAVTDQIK